MTSPKQRVLTYSLILGSVFATSYASSEASNESMIDNNLIIEYSAPQDEAERQLKQEIEQSGVNDTIIIKDFNRDIGKNIDR